jgi:MOSC domain-containing protein YiiM
MTYVADPYFSLTSCDDHLGEACMKIESVNFSQPVEIDFNGNKVITGIYKLPHEGPIAVMALGLACDTVVDTKVHGGLDQAIYIYHKEDYDWWSQQLGIPVAPGLFGENLTLSGVADGDSEVAWVIGDRLIINDVELEITAPRTPCFKLAVKMGDSSFVKKFAQANRPGAYARVIKTGCVQAGDSVKVVNTSENYASVKAVFALWHSSNKPLVELTRALSSPIAVVHKAALQGWYDEQVKT